MFRETMFVSMFERLVTAPLGRVLGTRLRSVTYIVLNADRPAFDVSDPNAFGGCQTVHLHFDGGALELDWDTPENGVMSGGVHHQRHVIVRTKGMRLERITEAESTGFGAVVATDAVPWRAVRGETLTGATVWGFSPEEGFTNPQAITLRFPSGQVTVSLGRHAQARTPLSLCHEGELLVFGAAEWEEAHRKRREQEQARHPAQPACPLVPLWER